MDCAHVCPYDRQWPLHQMHAKQFVVYVATPPCCPVVSCTQLPTILQCCLLHPAVYGRGPQAGRHGAAGGPQGQYRQAIPSPGLKGWAAL